jgi:hypothetical protein
MYEKASVQKLNKSIFFSKNTVSKRSCILSLGGVQSTKGMTST